MSNRIAVFNHSPNLLLLYEAILEPRGYEVHKFHEELADVKEIESLEPNLIILGNLRGVGEDELQWLRIIRKHPSLKSVPVLISTTASEKQWMVTGLDELSNVQVLTKPFDQQALIVCVRQLLQESVQ